MPNPSNPYEVTITGDGDYTFVTLSGITYGVVFTLQDDLFSAYTHLSHLFFDFSIEPRDLAGHIFPPKDYRTGDAIANIVEHFMGSNPDAALTYVCDSSDEKEYKRHLQFNRWFNQYNNKTLKLDKFDYALEGDVEYEDPEVNKIKTKHIVIYTGLMLAAKNTHRTALKDAFNNALKDSAPGKA